VADILAYVWFCRSDEDSDRVMAKLKEITVDHNVAYSQSTLGFLTMHRYSLKISR